MKKFIIYFFFFLLFLLSFFVSGVVDSQDGLQYLAVARNIYYGKGPTAPPYEYNTRQNIHMTTYIGKDGKNYSLTGLGFSLVMVPAAALADIVYKYYSVSPPIHFPLESDWIILHFASFTNIFFAALLGVVLFLYFIELKLTKRQALLMVFISIFTTNLFAFSKHIIPHMMFLTFLTLSFYLLKIYARLNKKILLVFSGVSYGVVIITYNLTFLLAVPAYVLYYIFLIQPKIKLKSLRKIAIDLILFLIGSSPFIYIFYWFENLRAAATYNLSSPAVATNFFSFIVNNLPISVFIEGVYGILLSPSRSIFIYTPHLLLIIFFWHKVPKRVLPELFLFLSYTFILTVFYSVTFFASVPGQGATGIWHGEASWGPRYLSNIIPFGMFVVASIYQSISKNIKRYIFLPLCLIGFYVELLGVLMPYQIKFHELERGFTINGSWYNVYAYSNLLPRYNAILMMSKKLIKLIDLFPKSFNHGEYNLRLYDGFSFAFNVGPERWRSLEKTGYISFDNNDNSKIENFSFDLINHPVSDTKAYAKVNFSLNGKQLFTKPVILKITERKSVNLPIDSSLIKQKGNELIIYVDYSKEKIFEENKQILGILAIFINGKAQNLESIYVPHVSELSQKMTGAVYKNWGGTNKDPWKIWDIHSQTFERLPDFWWIRNLYYWDVPKKWILTLLGINIAGAVFFGFKTISSFKKLNR